MFAENYKRQEILSDAKDGWHTVTIDNAVFVSKDGTEMLKIGIVFEDGHKLNPRHIIFSDPGKKGTPEQQKAFNYKLSAFCKSFNVPNDYDFLKLEELVGNIGRVLVETDGKFKTISRFVE